MWLPREHVGAVGSVVGGSSPIGTLRNGRWSCVGNPIVWACSVTLSRRSRSVVVLQLTRLCRCVCVPLTSAGLRCTAYRMHGRRLCLRVLSARAMFTVPMALMLHLPVPDCPDGCAGRDWHPDDRGDDRGVLHDRRAQLLPYQHHQRLEPGAVPRCRWGCGGSLVLGVVASAA